MDNAEYSTDLLGCWTRRGGSKNQKNWGLLIPPCIWRTIWKERNGGCFEDKTQHPQSKGRLFSVLVTCVITDAVGQTSSGVVFQTEKK